MKLKLNHWFVKENSLVISLMNFYIEINMVNNGLSCLLYIKDNDGNDMDLEFNSIEEAVSFTEEKIYKEKAMNNSDVVTLYNYYQDISCFDDINLRSKNDQKTRTLK